MLPKSSFLRPRLPGLFLLFAIVICFAAATEAQSALDGFDPNANGSILVAVVQADGKILLGGGFTTLSPNGGASVTRNNIARLNPDGTLDTTFNPNANGAVRAIALQADGKILVGGDFSGANSIGGQSRQSIARLDAATGLADSFDPNANHAVFSLVVQADGKILACGGFSIIGGQTRNSIARVDAATGMADSFDPNASGAVLAIAAQADGKVLAAGAFFGANSIGGQTRNAIARLDAVTGMADSWDPNSNMNVNTIAVQADGSILAGGFFTTIGGQSRNRIARLNATTGLADSFDPNVNSTVNTLAIQADGKILAGGIFTNIGGQARNRIARLDPITGLADAFDPNANSTVSSIVEQPDGKLLAVGVFTGMGGLTRNRIARLEKDGRPDQTLNLSILPTAGTVRATVVQPDGKILIGGFFDHVLDIARTNIARLNTDGTLDIGFNPNANDEVYSVAVQADGKILVCGDFTVIGGQVRMHIARLDKATGLPDSFNPNAESTVYSMAVQPDGKILVCGQFARIGGQNRGSIARLDPITGVPDSFNPNASGGPVPVTSLVVQADGKILVCGTFTVIGGQVRNHIARLVNPTGLADSFDPNASGPDPDFTNIETLALQADGKILVGGDFTTIGGQTRTNIARLDPTTGLADSFDPNANASIGSIAVQADGKILVGGSFRNVGGQARIGIARLDATTGTADSFNPEVSGTLSIVVSITVQTDGKILVGGSFTNIGGQTRSAFARLNNDIVALQNLGLTQTAANWTRGGSSTLLTRVTFEYSTDGVSYDFIGNGTAMGSNWTLTDLNFPTQQNIYIRARGYYRSGSYNGSESIQESVRNTFLSPSAVISGTVTYGNAAAPPKFISNATVTGAGSPTVMSTTAAPGGTAGQYTLTGFGAGSYTVSLSKTSGQNSITSNDAARIAQHVAGISLLTSDNQKVTADVSGNGAISSNDAAKIAQFVAGLPFSPPNLTSTWQFYLPPGPTFPVGASQTSRTYASVTSSVAGEDYVGLLIGEVTGNWSNTGARPVGSGPEKNITVDLPRLEISTGNGVIIPVSVQGAADKDVISYEFDLRYDPSVVQPNKNLVDLAGTASRGLSAVVNATQPGLLRVVVYGAMPIYDDGVLLNLRFTAVGAPRSTSPLSFERLMFNEGEPRVTVANGEVQLL
jgi:uncharacterized delta-60 repeat protein